MITARILVAVLAALVLAFDPCAAQDELTAEAATADAKTALEQGTSAYNRGDVIAAMRHYRTAADAGSMEAKVRLGWILDQSEDNAGAARLYAEAAEAGNANGQFRLAELYANGEGVHRDFRRAVKLFEAAAENGHTQAMRVLASAYEKGSLSLVPDATRAAYWKSMLDEAEQAESSAPEE